MLPQARMGQGQDIAGQRQAGKDRRLIRIPAGHTYSFVKTWLMPFAGLVLSLAVFVFSIVFVISAHGQQHPALNTNTTTFKPSVVATLPAPNGGGGNVAVYVIDHLSTPFTVNLSVSPLTVTKSKSPNLRPRAAGATFAGVEGNLLDLIFSDDIQLAYASSGEQASTLAECQTDIGQVRLNAAGVTVGQGGHLCLAFSNSQNRLLFLTASSVSKQNVALQLDEWIGG